MYSVAVYSLVQLAFILCKWWPPSYCFVVFLFKIKSGETKTTRKSLLSWNAFHNFVFLSFRCTFRPINQHRQPKTGRSWIIAMCFPLTDLQRTIGDYQSVSHFHRKTWSIHLRHTYIQKSAVFMWPFSTLLPRWYHFEHLFWRQLGLSFVVAIICNFLLSRLLQYFSTIMIDFVNL